MLRKKLIKIISKILIISSLIVTLLMPINSCLARSNKSILIYHSHTSEAYTDDYNVVKAGEDLSNKLRKKGYIVHHVIDKFDNDYNNSYYCSNKMLKGKDLNSYDLIIDYHRDAINDKKIVTKDKNNNEVAKTMFVITKEQENFNKQNNIVKNLEKELITVSESDMVRKTWYYNKGINYYSQNLSDNIILIENGFNTNTELEIKRANTYLSYSIDKVLKK